jgi:UDP-N-acetylglucosamine acyltransferase
LTDTQIRSDISIKESVSVDIHPAAIVHPSAEIGNNVKIGPWSYIGPNVFIEDNSIIYHHVVIKGYTRIGQDNKIYQFNSIGEDSQDKKYHGEVTWLEIGNGNTIRENCTLHRGTVQDNGLTLIGNNNFIMAYTHIAHDCVLGNDNILANNTALAGHVHVGDGVIFGGYTAIHQKCKVGSYSMTAAKTVLFKDLPAFVMASGHPAITQGMNYEGMRRRGYSPKVIRQLNQCYKIIYRMGYTTSEAVAELQKITPSKELNLLIDSLKTSKRGITR